MNSGFLNGLTTAEAKSAMCAWLEAKGLGAKQVNYKLRDWLFSRQRYWGEPIPIVHCAKCAAVPVPENQLPLRLPEVADFKPTGTGQSPLANVPGWINTTCPACGGAANRETNTMPQWAGSCWYYLGSLTLRTRQRLGTKTWKNLGGLWIVMSAAPSTPSSICCTLVSGTRSSSTSAFVSTKEPFQKLRHQGMILSYSNRDANGNYHPYEDVEYDEQNRAKLAATGEILASQVEKMSKSKKNVVNPDVVVKRYGADAFRLYEMFMGPFEQSKPWDMRSIEGVYRFLRRGYILINDLEAAPKAGDGLAALRHRTIKKVGEDIETFGFNTGISALMIYLNAIQDEKTPAKIDLETFLVLLNPFAPASDRGAWEKLGHKDLLCRQAWPTWDAQYLVDALIEYPVQVNGKLRATFTIAAGAEDAAVKDAALTNEKVKAAIDGKRIMKVILIPKKAGQLGGQMNKLKIASLALIALSAACGTDVAYRPTPQLIPQHVQRLALRPIVNKTQQFGLEDKLVAARARRVPARRPLSPGSRARGAGRRLGHGLALYPDRRAVRLDAGRDGLQAANPR